MNIRSLAVNHNQQNKNKETANICVSNEWCYKQVSFFSLDIRCTWGTWPMKVQIKNTCIKQLRALLQSSVKAMVHRQSPGAPFVKALLWTGAQQNRLLQPFKDSQVCGSTNTDQWVTTRTTETRKDALPATTRFLNKDIKRHFCCFLYWDMAEMS